jgi:uncharacterized protein DUF2505
MRFTMDHSFAVDLARLERAIFHPDLYARLVTALDRVEQLTELERTETPEEIRKRVRVRPRYDVPSFARGKLSPEMTEYVEVSRYDRRAHRFTYEIEPNIPEAWRDRFVSRGTYSLAESGGRTQRRIEVEIVLKIPLLGGMAERYIAEQVKANFDQEARALERFAQEL